jgi:hypothetical protein
MVTPGQPERGYIPALYGESGGGINHGLSAISRRGVIAVALALPFAASAANVRKVKALAWEGTALLTTGRKTLSIHVKTRVEPFVRARSETYLVDQGPASLRTLIIEPDGGWVERDGTRTPLPQAQAVHEREQYGIYGYLLHAGETGGEGTHLVAIRDGFPAFTYGAGPSGFPDAAEYEVSAPDGTGSIHEVIWCDDVVKGAPILWPKRITIEQPGQKPAFRFELVIDTLSVEFV